MSFKTFSRQHQIFLVLSLLMANALFWSKWLIGLFVFLTFVCALIDWEQLKVRKDLGSKFVQFIKAPEYILITLFFLATPVSAWIHHDSAAVLNDMQLKLPYLLLPFAYFLFKPVSREWMAWFSTLFIIMSTLFCAGVLINFLMNIDQSIDRIEVGKAITTPDSHIRFSLLVSLSILFGCICLIERLIVLKSLQGRLITFLIVFNFVFLHILAVKSGLGTTYLGLFFLLFYMLLKGKMIKAILVGLVTLMLIPLVAYQVSPTLRQKINYTTHDWSHISDPGSTEYSDVERVRSIEYGLDIFMENPWLGTGRSNLVVEMQSEYRDQHGEISRVKTPHNQFVYILASMGLLGALMCFPGIIYPFFSRGLFQNPFLIVAGITIGASCMVEATLETTVGMNLHLLFVLIGISMLSSNQAIDKRPID